MKQYWELNRLRLLAALALTLGVVFGMIDPALAMASGLALTTTTGQLGNGTIFQCSSGSPTTFVTVNNVDNIELDTGSSAKVDMSNMTSSWKEFLLGLPDPGSLTAEIDLDFGDAGQAALRAARVARTKCDFKVILPSGTTPNILMQGYVAKFPIKTAVDASITVALECFLTGPITLS